MCLASFGTTYTLRAKYMFSLETQQLIPSSVKTMLPWNTIEETCRYVRENTLNVKQTMSEKVLIKYQALSADRYHTQLSLNKLKKGE